MGKLFLPCISMSYLSRFSRSRTGSKHSFANKSARRRHLFLSIRTIWKLFPCFGAISPTPLARRSRFSRLVTSSQGSILSTRLAQLPVKPSTKLFVNLPNNFTLPARRTDTSNYFQQFIPFYYTLSASLVPTTT